jgi:uncharacterized protein (DUF1800 family)
MKKSFNRIPALALLMVIATTVSTSFFSFTPDKTALKFPFKQAGLTERQAAAHLLSRFTFGAKPGEIDAVVSQGLEKWFTTQLQASLPDDSLNQLLSQYETLKMSNTEIVEKFPRPGQLIKMARKEGILDGDSLPEDKGKYKKQVAAIMEKNGMKPQRELFRQLISQKILRASVTNNQLQEVLTDFWFNHFNVSLTKNQCAEFVMAYERDAIRPNVFGKFENLVLTTAKSPAMLAYLDNFSSAGGTEDISMQMSPQQKKKFAKLQEEMPDSARAMLKKFQQNRKNQGLNENYAREVMELHTLGVDGGYTQQDVTQAARVLTGWTIYPMGENGYGAPIKRAIERIGEDKLTQFGYVREGDFVFVPTRHDSKEKVVLGKKFPGNGGYNEGVELLQMLSHHPSTAKFISRKLAVRFVSDNPPQSLIDKMAKTFTEKDGDIRQVLITMVTAPEFWTKDALREKTKSPFELAISAVRGLDAKVNQPFQLYTWIERMGQKVYFYQAPTGFPDKGAYWINTGSLLNRMNFGLALASQRIPGIKINLASLNHNREPESTEAALRTYTKLVLPERDVEETVKRLTPMLNDPALGQKIEQAAGNAKPPTDANMSMSDNDLLGGTMMDDKDNDKLTREKISKKNLGKGASISSMQTTTGNNSMLAQVVGIIIGSPEFQRK